MSVCKFVSGSGSRIGAWGSLIQGLRYITGVDLQPLTSTARSELYRYAGHVATFREKDAKERCTVCSIASAQTLPDAG